MPELLAALDAFYLEHRRCGVLDAGVEVWMSCDCGAGFRARWLALLDSRTTQEEDTLMPPREDAAKANLGQAISDAKGDFVLAWLKREIEGYAVGFRKGQVEHIERGIDEAVLEDGPKTEPIRKLVRKVKSAFGEF